MAVYSIHYTLNRGTNNPNNPSSYDTDQLPITLQAPTKSNSTFLWWSEWSSSNPQVSYTIEAWTTWDLSLEAWRNPTLYKVLHIRQRENEPGYSLHEAEDKYWVPWQYTNAQPKDYPWMIQVWTIEQLIINPDGYTYVRIFYDRLHVVPWGIMINGQPLSKRYIDEEEVVRVMLNWNQIRPIYS